MDVEQNWSRENEPSLVVYDGLLPMVCYTFVQVCVFILLCICLYYISVQVRFSYQIKKFQHFLRSVKITINRTFLLQLHMLKRVWKVMSLIDSTTTEWYIAWLFFYLIMPFCIEKLLVCSFSPSYSAPGSVWLPSFSSWESRGRCRLPSFSSWKSRGMCCVC